MDRWIALTAGALASLAGIGVAAAQNAPNPPVNIDTSQAVNGCLTPAEQRRPLAQITMAQRRRVVACVNAAAARQANAQLPVQIDEVTRLDRITTAGTLLTYHYTLAREASELPGNVRALLESSTRAHVCGQQNMVQTMHMGGVYRYRWVDRNGRLIHQVRIAGC
jgi:hypothetical protein